MSCALIRSELSYTLSSSRQEKTDTYLQHLLDAVDGGGEQGMHFLVVTDVIRVSDAHVEDVGRKAGNSSRHHLGLEIYKVWVFCFKIHLLPGEAEKTRAGDDPRTTPLPHWPWGCLDFSSATSVPLCSGCTGSARSSLPRKGLPEQHRSSEKAPEALGDTSHGL